MQDTANDNSVETISYSFTLSFKVGGLVDSNLTEDETIAKLTAELTDFYGPEGFEVIDFRQATSEEIETYRRYLAEDLEAEADGATIN